jgi:hypothetical protein
MRGQTHQSRAPWFAFLDVSRFQKQCFTKSLSHMAQLREMQQKSLAPHFSAIISSNVRFLAEKWGAEKWDQLLSSIVFDLMSRWDV